jgi:diguanylate cyclase (GGDEF)-like protein
LESRAHRIHIWGALGALLILAGSTGAIFAALGAAHNAANNSRKAFVASSEVISSTLQLAIQHEQDLIIGAGGFIVGSPNATNSQFGRWGNSVQAFARYPELVSIGFSATVPASQLASFAARSLADPPGPLGPGGTFQVQPPGSRPYYCLPQAEFARSPQALFPAGYDFCAGSFGNILFASRDSGKASYLPIKSGNAQLLFIDTQVYRGGIVPATVAARRSAWLTGTGMTVVPGVLLARALQNHPNTAVQFRYHAFGSNAVFTSGVAPRGAQSVVANLHNGWTVETFGAVAGRGIFDNGGAILLLFGGIALSLLLGVLIFVLGTARAHLMVLVEERTNELRFQALHDALTGMPNRALITDRIDQLLARNRRNGTVPAALYVDLDDFKNVNDSLGHEAGDQLLVAVASRMESTLRGADTIGRMGGDEFVVLIDGGDLMVAPELVAERMVDVMRQPFELAGASMPLIVNTSIGIAVGDRATGGELLRDADIALYQAKAAGKNRFEFFRPEMQTHIGRRIELEFDLRSSLSDDQFRLVYQPIYNLEDFTIVGVEALLRWQHPTEGIIQPDEFIPILEQTGQIREVGQWVLNQACAQMATWHSRGDTIDLSVNVSARQLDDDAIVGHIRDALSASGLPATSLIVEVTETTLMRDASAAVTRLQAIKDLGVRIAIDDFGTGYSSLGYLRQFPVDCIKIDKSFTNAISTSSESKALVRTFVQLGKDLGLKTLAEGVETTGEMDMLQSGHVDEAQGFLMARPLDADALETQILAPLRAMDLSTGAGEA